MIDPVEGSASGSMQSGGSQWRGGFGRASRSHSHAGFDAERLALFVQRIGLLGEKLDAKVIKLAARRSLMRLQ
jgi:hypothetical protein